jgi:hypothetical protein
VIHSIQHVLFPSDPKSQAFLRSLVRDHQFDPDCLYYNASDYQLEGEQYVSYYGLETRLMDLYEELENPAPHGILEKWLERKSSSRYTMLTAIIGVAVAIALGALSLAVSIFAAWVAYQQWKNPS